MADDFFPVFPFISLNFQLFLEKNKFLNEILAQNGKEFENGAMFFFFTFDLSQSFLILGN
jgi:hypothetical protein